MGNQLELEFLLFQEFNEVMVSFCHVKKLWKWDYGVALWFIILKDVNNEPWGVQMAIA